MLGISYKLRSCFRAKLIVRVGAAQSGSNPRRRSIARKTYLVPPREIFEPRTDFLRFSTNICDDLSMRTISFTVVGASCGGDLGRRLLN